jgi:hypothetical protein
MVTERIDRCQGCVRSMLSGFVRSVSLPGQPVSGSRDQPRCDGRSLSPAVRLPSGHGLGQLRSKGSITRLPAPTPTSDPDGQRVTIFCTKVPQPPPVTPAHRVSHPRDQAPRGVLHAFRRLSINFQTYRIHPVPSLNRPGFGGDSNL